MNDKDLCWPCEQEIIDKLPPCPLQCRSQKCKAFETKKKDTLIVTPIVWVLGGPASGKSTQCTNIVSRYGFILLMVNNLVEEELNSGTERHRCLLNYLKRNETLPNDMIVDLLKTAIFKHVLEAKGFICDGFPSDKKTCIFFDKTIKPSTLILYLEASYDTLTKRLMQRDSSASEQAVANRVKTILKSHELMLFSYSEKVYRINAENDAATVFRDMTEILDYYVPIWERPRVQYLADHSDQLNSSQDK